MSVYQKMQEISCRTADMLASQEGHCSVALVNLLVSSLVGQILSDI